MLDGPAPGAENMRRDRELLERCAGGDITGAIRLYWFDPPCLSLGRMQPDEDADVEACARDGIDVVRRPSGGRAVLHQHEVTYAVVCREDDADLGGDVLTACARIQACVAAGLRTLGVATTTQSIAPELRGVAHEAAAIPDCFARPAAHELLDPDGRKLVGSAQARRGAALLQHGSVLLEPPRAAAYLRAGHAIDEPTRGLRALAGRDLTQPEVVLALAQGFRSILGERMLDTTL